MLFQYLSGYIAIFYLIHPDEEPINRALFESNARYVRTALVAYNAFFADGNDFSKKEYLRRIVYDSFVGK